MGKWMRFNVIMRDTACWFHLQKIRPWVRYERFLNSGINIVQCDTKVLFLSYWSDWDALSHCNTATGWLLLWNGNDPWGFNHCSAILEGYLYTGLHPKLMLRNAWYNTAMSHNEQRCCTWLTTLGKAQLHDHLIPKWLFTKLWTSQASKSTRFVIMRYMRTLILYDCWCAWET